MNHAQEKERLRRTAASLGLDALGVVALPLPKNLGAALAEADPCPFTPPDPVARVAPQALLPNARAAIVILFPYRPACDDPLPPAIPDTPIATENAPNIARYARSRDYHLICRQYLDRLAARLATSLPDETFYPFVDTSPLPDRYLAYAAGLGYFGLNHCLINDRYGTYTVIGGLLTTYPYPADAPLEKKCLGCKRCVRACPGHSLSHDAFHYRTCKSYLTQKKGKLTCEEIAIVQKTSLIFGCDTCQDVCPHNRNAHPSPLPEFTDARRDRLDAAELSRHSNKTFRAAHGDRAYAWRGKTILLRNLACLAPKKADAKSAGTPK